MREDAISKRSRFINLGVALILGSTLFGAAMWYIVGYMPLVALAISGVILGAVSLALGRSVPRLSADASLLLDQAASDNIAALVEELGLRAKAMYLPSYLTKGRARALIPFHGNSSGPSIQKPLDLRLIVKFGNGPEDIGVLVATPGSSALELAQVTDGASSNELEATLSALLVGTLDLVGGVRVERNGDNVVVEVARLALQPRNHPSNDILGSPVATIVASVVAESAARPVTVVSEATKGRGHVIELRLHGEVNP